MKTIKVESGEDLEPDADYILRNGSMKKLTVANVGAPYWQIGVFLYQDNATDGHLVIGESDPHPFDIMEKIK